MDFTTLFMKILLLWPIHLVYSEINLPGKQLNYRFKLWSRKNSTGNWMAKMLLLHPEKKDKTDLAWEVEVESGKVKTKNGYDIMLGATIVGPGSGATSGGGSSGTDFPESPEGGDEQFPDYEEGKDPGGNYTDILLDDNHYGTGPDNNTESSTSYEEFDGVGCFKLYPAQKARIWSEANATCANDGASLISLSAKVNPEMLDSIIMREGMLPLGRATCGEYFFVGAGRGDAGTFYSLNGVDLEDAGNVNWAPGQPDHKPDEDCVAYYYKNGLHDVPCSWKLGFICEKDHC